MLYFIAFGIIFFTSLLFGMAGIGSATIVIPSLIIIGFPLQESIAIGLTVNIIVSSIISFTVFKNREIKMHETLPLLAGAFISPPLGVYVSHLVSKDTILWIFFAILVFGAYKSFKKYFEKDERKSRFHEMQDHEHLKAFLFFVFGVGGGFLAGMIGIGGGSVLLPIFIMLGISPKKIIPLVAPLVFVSSTMGLLTRVKIVKSYDLKLILIAIGAAFTAGFFCNRYRDRVNKRKLRLLLSFLLLIVSLKIGWMLLF